MSVSAHALGRILGYLVVVFVIGVVGLFVVWFFTLDTTLWMINGEKLEIDMSTFRVKHTRLLFGINVGQQVEQSPISLKYEQRGKRDESGDWHQLYVKKHGAMFSKQTKLYHEYIRICNQIGRGYPAIQEDEIAERLRASLRTAPISAD